MRAFSILALIPFIASSLVSALNVPADAIPGELRGWTSDAPTNVKRVERLSNAQRLARGLPPLAPTRGGLFDFILA